jgi:uncharacterized protein YjlB
MGQSRFTSLLSTLGLGRAARPKASPSLEPEVLHLARNGWVPNNERLPVLIYRAVVIPVPRRVVSTMEDKLRGNWWLPQSLNSIYDFHHYHSSAHEALGVARGTARLVLGGEGGPEVKLGVGDVVVLPAGTGHCKVEASLDFLVVGAYPQDMDWDICKAAPTAKELERMQRLEIPAFDPVWGRAGALPKLWGRDKAKEKPTEKNNVARAS